MRSSQMQELVSIHLLFTLIGIHHTMQRRCCMQAQRWQRTSL